METRVDHRLPAEDPDIEQTEPEPLSESEAGEESAPVRLVPLPPDGGYGWVIVAASFLGNALVDGMCSAFGVFLPLFLDHFSGASVAKVALVGSLMPCLFLTTGPVVSVLINSLGCRVVSMSGGLVTCLALVLATFSPHVDVLILTYGILGGIGLALVYLPSMVMVGYYFEKRRAMASGIASSGSGFGMVVFAPLAAYLTNQYSWQGALILLGGVMLQGLVLGAVMRPLELPQARSTCQSNSQLTEEDSLCAEQQQNIPDVQIRPFEHQSEVLKPDESVQLYRKALQNAFSRQRAHTMSHSTCSDFTSASLHDNSGSCKHIGLNSSGMFDLQCHTHAQNGGKIISTQSCQELPGETTPGGRVKPHAQKRHFRSSAHAHGKLTPSITSTLAVQSCHEIAAKSHHHHPHYHPDNGTQSDDAVSPNRARMIRELLNPLRRQDIFYSGSIANLRQYKSHPDLKSYRASVTVIPEDDATKPEDAACWRNAQNGVLNLIDLTILANPYFLVICLASVFIQVGYFIPIVYLVDYAVSLGSSTQQAAIIISVIGVSNTLGRSLGGCLANVPGVNYVHLNNVTVLLSGGATLLVGPCATSFPALLVYGGVLGFCVGPFVSLTTIFLVDYLGLEKLTNSFGLLSMVRGLASMLGAPIAGILLERTKSYALAFYFGGSMFVCGGLVYYLLPCVKLYQKRKT